MLLGCQREHRQEDGQQQGAEGGYTCTCTCCVWHTQRERVWPRTTGSAVVRSNTAEPSPPQEAPHVHEVLAKRVISTATTAFASLLVSVPLYSQPAYEPPASAAHAHSRRSRCRQRLPSVLDGSALGSYSMNLRADDHAVMSPPSIAVCVHDLKPRAAVSKRDLMSSTPASSNCAARTTRAGGGGQVGVSEHIVCVACAGYRLQG